MGADFFIADRKNTRLFEVGRSGAITQVVPVYAFLHQLLSEELILLIFGHTWGDHFVRSCQRSSIKNCSVEQVRDVFDFCEEADWLVSIVSDEADPPTPPVPRGWIITHSVYSQDLLPVEDRIPRRHGQ